MANQEAIRKWYIALKSGEYKQGKDRLRTGDTYCCWGVACEISGTGRWMQETLQGTSEEHYYWSDSYGYTTTGIPPTEVHRWLGVENNYFADELRVPPERVEEAQEILADVEDVDLMVNRIDLATLNDCGGSFDLIADIIWYNYGEGDPPEVPGE